MSQTKPNMPSLLMQAARSAAIADGLMPKGKKKETKSQQKVEGQQQGQTLSRAPNGDAAAAALAMLASGNGGNTTTSTAASSARPPQADAERSRKHEIGTGTVSSRVALTSASNSSTPSPALTIGASNLPNTASSNVPRNSNTASGLHSNRQLPAVTQQKQRLSSFSASGPATSNPASAGSAAHRLAVAHSIPVAPKPNLSASSHIPQSVQAPRSSSGASGSGGKKKGPPLRRGKWTPEEEAYANRLIMEFKAGLLPLTDGTTLRTFLSKLLNCDPMRISKKFVGSNCIGKQVFRRRTADINRLTTEQIQQSRAELSELERRFLERVAQTNRVKSSGVNNNSNTGNASTVSSSTTTAKIKLDDLENVTGATPPWLRPPNGFKHGTGAATAAASLSSGSNRAALAGRALLQGNNGISKTGINSGMSNKSGSAGLLALMEFQQRQNRDNMFSQSLGNSASNLLAAAAAAESKSGGDALAQISRNVSAAKMAGLTSGNSMTNLMLKTGLSRDHLSQLVRDHRNSSNSLSNMMERQSSLDALMSLDFQSLQSIDNLANLIQTGRGNQVPRSGLKNWSSESGNNLAASVANSNGNLSNLANARRLQSEGRMENLIRSLSSGNVGNKGHSNGGGSNANFNNLLQSMQNNLGGSSNNLLGSASALNLANMLRVDSSTGLTALRMQDGLAQRNTSVDDFLSLVASGDIPHQDPHMLNVPLQSVLQQQQNNSSAAAQFLAQQQLIAQATSGGGNNALQRFASLSGLSNNSNSGISSNNNSTTLGERIASLGGLANHNSAASLLSQYASQQGSNSASVAALAQHQHQANAMNASVLAAAAQQENDLKRKFKEETGNSRQGSSKR